MSALVAHTHSIVWYLCDRGRLSPVALAALEDAERAGSPIHVPSICLVEVAYLVEKGRLLEVAFERLSAALVDVGTSLTIAPLDLAAARAVRQVPHGALPDMPDRIIAATALSLNLSLVTRDQRIRATGVTTIW